MNITEFAHQIGLSISTVSRALNNYEDVSPKTREMVRERAVELGYVPNAASSRLRRKKRLETVGFLAPQEARSFLNPVLLETLAGMDNALASSGVNLSVLSLHSGKDEVSQVQSLVNSGAVDFIVLTRTRRHDSRVEFLIGRNFPFMTFGRVETGEPYNFVDIDHRSAAEQSVSHLASLGHHRIALLNGPEDFMLHYRRRTGFESAMKANGRPILPEFVQQCEVNAEAAQAYATDLLNMDERPTAIVCASDYIALGVYVAARDAGLVIGKDLSVIGCDDNSSSAFLTPGLTSNRADRHKAGQMLAQVILTKHGATPHQTSTVIPMNLVERGSTGPAPGGKQ